MVYPVIARNAAGANAEPAKQQAVIGLQVKGLAQVSMNLLDYRKTSMKDVFSAIRKEAAGLGCPPLYSELIGMLPRDALSGTTPEELLLQDFD